MYCGIFGWPLDSTSEVPGVTSFVTVKMSLGKCALRALDLDGLHE